MKMGLAQIRAIKGEIAENIERHRAITEKAAGRGVDFVLFPELSLTGYEPALAKALAIGPEDSRLEVFQRISDERGIVIGAGAPTEPGGGAEAGSPGGEDTSDTALHDDTLPRISLILFQPNRPRWIYAKRYLHEDEEPFFAHGSGSSIVEVRGVKVGLAICYELSVPEHAEAAVAGGAEVYLVTAAKLSSGVVEAHRRLPEIARQYGIPALLVNSVGPQDTFVGAGGSAVWNERGELIRQLDAESEGLLVFDTDSHEAQCVNPDDGQQDATV